MTLRAKRITAFDSPPSRGAAPSINDVAAHARVSIATVSRVINARGKYSEETRQRVLASVKTLEYSPSTAARSLARGRTHVIALIMPSINADFLQPLLVSVVDAAMFAGFDVLLTLRPNEYGHRQIGRHNVDGAVVYANSADPTELRRLHSSGCPVVLMYESAPQDLDIPSVLLENIDGARQMTEHLIKLGRRKIAFLRGLDGLEDGHQRELGFRQTLAEHGIPAIEDLIGEGGFNAAVAFQTVTAWLERGLEFDAVFASDDDSASGVLQALAQAGIAVPSAVAVVGFDDAPLAANLTPPLTTVRAMTKQVGYEAVRLLVNLIETGSSEAQIRLPTELVIRRSCGSIWS
jgi:LacI family transcriptional regulator